MEKPQSFKDDKELIDHLQKESAYKGELLEAEKETREARDRVLQDFWAELDRLLANGKKMVEGEFKAAYQRTIVRRISDLERGYQSRLRNIEEKYP
ncbi:MAG: hypothetical protein NTY77_18585 [Elusimicrobia bacterium]|nr:hypothetical protein [Elusimicrobiota bacterium]